MMRCARRRTYAPGASSAFFAAPNAAAAPRSAIHAIAIIRTLSCGSASRRSGSPARARTASGTRRALQRMRQRTPGSGCSAPFRNTASCTARSASSAQRSITCRVSGSGSSSAASSAGSPSRDVTYACIRATQARLPRHCCRARHSRGMARARQGACSGSSRASTARTAASRAGSAQSLARRARKGTTSGPGREARRSTAACRTRPSGCMQNQARRAQPSAAGRSR